MSARAPPKTLAPTREQLQQQPPQQQLQQQQQPQRVAPIDQTSSQMGQNGGLMDELDAKIRGAINHHLPDVVSAIISMVNNQRPSAPINVQPPGLRDNERPHERLNELSNYSNLNSRNTDTNVIGLGPNPLVSFSNTGQSVAQPVQTSYRPVEVPALRPVVRLVGI